MEAGTLVALAAMIISLFLAILKYVDRRKAAQKQLLEETRKSANLDVERDSIVVRGAEGALLLMEKTLKTANEECEKRINELEEENAAQGCEIKELRNEIASLRTALNELQRRVDNG